MDEKNPIIPAAGTARLTGVELVGDGDRIAISTEQVVGWQRNDRGGLSPVTNMGPDWYWFWETWDASTTNELRVVHSLLKQAAELDRDGGKLETVAKFAKAVLDALPDTNI